MAAGWLGLVLLLGLAADRWRVERLALQADLLAVTALIGLFAWRLGTTGSGWWDHKAPLLAAVALLYAGMRRKTVLAGSRNYVAPAYSWAATVLLALVAADLSTDLALTPVWVALGVGIFEIGRFSRKGFLRWQGFFLAALGFARFLGYDLWASFLGRASDGAPAWHGGRFSLVNSLLLEVLILSAVGYLLLERTRNADRCARREHIAGTAADALGTLSIALWFAYRFPSDWVPVENGAAWVTAIWAGMAAVLLGLAWLMRRMAFQAQALALVLAVVARGLFVDLFAEDAAGFWQGPLFHLGVTAAILLAALPFAFRLRGGAFWQGATIVLPGGLGPLLRRPEQVFFFAAFGLEAVALAVKLSSGHITIAWSLLGLGTFLFALVVGERAYRLAGLGLLLVSVAKIVLMDVWKLSRPDRIVTLIVLGLALLAVSFLYTRFGTVMRRYL
jgi:hypothetical protein